MATFDLGKNIDEVQEPELMPEDWYPFEISEEPTLEPNNAMKAGGASADKAGYNTVVPISCISDVPEYAARGFWPVYLAHPNESDRGKFNRSGMSTIDSKVKRNAEFVKAFGGEVEGSTFTLSKGMRGQLYVNQGLDQSGQNVVNEIDPWAGARPFGDTDEESRGSDVPF